MTLTTLPGNISRVEALQAILKADAGKISEARQTLTDKIAAFVIEPRGSGTTPSVDTCVSHLKGIVLLPASASRCHKRHVRRGQWLKSKCA